MNDYKMRTIVIFLLIISILATILSGCDETENNEIDSLSCSITNPKYNDEFEFGRTIVVSTNANDDNITEVIFNINDSTVANLSSSPYIYDWKTSDSDVGYNSIRVTVINNNFDSASDGIMIWIKDSRPEVNFYCDDTAAIIGQKLQFYDLSTNDPIKWIWNFGDDSTSNEQNPSHTYNSTGTYTVSLRAINNYGCNIEILNDYITVNNSEIDTIDIVRNINKTVRIGE